MKINDVQRLLLDSYKSGAFAYIQRGEDLRECGDALLKLMFHELGDDCILEAREKGIDTAVMAARRLSAISAHVNAMIPVVYTGMIPMSAPRDSVLVREPEHA